MDIHKSILTFTRRYWSLQVEREFKSRYRSSEVDKEVYEATFQYAVFILRKTCKFLNIEESESPIFH